MTIVSKIYTKVRFPPDMAEHKLRVSSKGEIVIPEAIRIKYGVSRGTELLLKPLDENRLIIEKIPKLSALFARDLKIG